MKISIVTAYHNRRKLFINTLESITKTSYENFEVIAIDDSSNDEHRIDDLPEKFKFLKVHRIEPENKNHINPCIPFNKGFELATGDIVIIQNPECFHTDDIISYVSENLKEDDYFVFGCFSLTKEKTEIFCENINTDINQFLVNQPVNSNSSDGWYNHSIYRPVGYHFTSAIYKSKLDELNGFDENFAFGIGFDDDEFLYRVKKICDLKMVNNPLVLHQYHYNLSNMTPETYNKLVQINKNLLLKTISN